MATELERLSVLIEANTKSYERAMVRLQQQTEKALRQSKKSADELNLAFERASRAAGDLAKGFFAIGTAKAAFGFIRDTIKQLADLQDMADKIGIGTDRLQQLQYQAEQTGVGFDTLTSGLEQFIKRLSQARQGQGELADLFKAQRTPIDPKSFKDVNEALDAFIDLIGKGADEAARMQIATMGFGKGGGDLALMFVGGTEQAKKFNAELHEMFTPEQLRAAARYDDLLEKITRTASVNIKGGIITFLENNERAFNRLSEEGFVKFFQDPLGLGVTAAEDAGGRVADAFSKGFSNKGHEDLQRAMEEKVRHVGDVIAKPKTGDTDYTILPPDPEKINQAKNSLRELLQLRYKHIQIVTDEHKKVEDFIAELQREYEVLGKTNEQQRVSNELHQAGIFATGDDRKQIEALVHSIEEKQKALDRLDEFRDAAGSAFDAFAQSIAAGETAAQSLNSALKDILQTILRIAEEKAIAALFGVSGTSGGGVLGGLIGSLFSSGGAAAVPASAPSVPTIGAPAAAAPVVQLHVVEGALFRPVVAQISGAVAVKQVQASEKRMPSVVAANLAERQRAYG